jgi:signal transduction histidine kinase/CheY-like chemotaxis protein
VGVGDRLTHLGMDPLARFLSPPPSGLRHEINLDDGSARIFEVEAQPVAAGGWVLVLRDVTQEREFEERAQRQERLAAVGQLAAGIAHDFNNIMAVIVLYTQLAMRALEDPRASVPPKKSRARLETVTQQAERAADLIRQILNFSRSTVLERQPLDVGPFLKELIKLLQRTLPENIRLKLSIGETMTAEAYMVDADLTRMQQMIMNLALNARDAMPEGGELHISLDRREIAADGCPVSEMAPGSWVCISVTDTGVGIAPDVLPRIFEPFFTTKPLGQGTGLGLSQVKNIIELHDGHVTVESQLGQGTTFILYLPALPETQMPRVAGEAAAVVFGQGESIMVVEDNPTTRQALCDSLEALGYRALPMDNGLDAMRALQNRALEVALVLSDAVMPGMGGVALFYALKRARPEVPMILISGYATWDELQSLHAQGLTGWVQKPVSFEQLAEVVAQALRAAG